MTSSSPMPNTFLTYVRNVGGHKLRECMIAEFSSDIFVIHACMRVRDCWQDLCLTFKKNSFC